MHTLRLISSWPWNTPFLILCLYTNCLASAQLEKSRPASSLAGQWRFDLDAQNVGIAQEWFRRDLPHRIRLPGTTDEAGYGEKTTESDYGMLTRVYRYIGPAWFQRDIEIPLAWKDKEIELFLERVLWESQAWVDDAPAQTLDSLGTPHRHRLGKLSPGKHRLTVRVNNQLIHPLGDKGHCYTEHTQTIWNGLVGRIELRALDPLHLGLLRIFPKAAARQLEVEIGLINRTGAPQRGIVRLSLRDLSSGTIVLRDEVPCQAEAERATLRPSLSLPAAPKLWDEFAPNLYALETTLVTGPFKDTALATFGFRTVGRTAHHISINGRPVFIRGNLDCVHFPLTGYPPCDAESWRRLFRIYKEYGLNNVRFHSWCPPEAAFAAADDLGIYIQAEVLWIDSWMTRDDPARPDMITLGRPLGLGRNDRTIDAYARAEMRRMLDAYGNHPSFVFFAIGNELGSSDFAVMGRWIKEEKERDPRRLYAASTARDITPWDDFSDTHLVPGIGSTVNRLGVPHTDWDYEPSDGQAPVPIIAHELGQMPVYPVWDEIAKYTGVLRTRNLDRFRLQARKNGIEHLSHPFQAASGAMNRIVYKAEIEAQFRTPSSGGFSLLSMQDYSGQGEALVGWLDSFYDSKGILTPEQFRRYCNSTVPLARFAKYVWTCDEPFRARAQAAHYGSKSLAQIRPAWRLRDSMGRTLASGNLPAVTIPVGTVSALGDIAASLQSVTNASRLNLELKLEDTPFVNDWNLWVFPARLDTREPPGLLVSTNLDNALIELAQGRTVLLLAHALGYPHNTAFANWLPVFWSASWSAGQDRQTLGAWVQCQHPALAQFPTASHLDWQWHALCDGARGFVLDHLPPDYQPIVQPVSDFHFNHKLGTLFEFRIREGGRLLVCGYNLLDNLDHLPEARQLRRSLLAYMAGPQFAPKQEISAPELRRLFTPPK